MIYAGDPYRHIYGRRGAVNAMAQIDAPECALTESFRFGATFAVLASRLPALLGEHTGSSPRGSRQDIDRRSG